MKKLLISLCALFFLVPSISSAQRSTYLSEGEMEIISVGEDIDSVFISNPKVADYQVIDKRKVALFGKA